jgi:hypothetical protein
LPRLGVDHDGRSVPSDEEVSAELSEVGKANPHLARDRVRSELRQLDVVARQPFPVCAQPIHERSMLGRYAAAVRGPGHDRQSVIVVSTAA